MVVNRNKLKEKVRKITEGVLSELIDIVLWEIAFVGASSVNFSRSTWEARVKADKFINEVNYETIKNTLEILRRRGFIKRSNRKKVWPQITDAGRKKLKSSIPFYDEKRTWDKRIYLMTYDIPEAKRKDRELLRRFAKKIGMGMLQESVWITPYNPREILAEYIKTMDLYGTIIVSDIGQDGAIGDEDLQSLVARVYNLEKVNKRYKDYINDIYSGRLDSDIQKKFTFLSILSDDPQLPWDLLPLDWHSKEAYRIYKQT